MKVYYDAPENKAVLVADDGYVLTDYNGSGGTDVLYYRSMAIEYFYLTPSDYEVASRIHAITMEEDAVFKAQKQSIEQSILNDFFNLGDNNNEE